jgi:hypothetical protein
MAAPDLNDWIFIVQEILDFRVSNVNMDGVVDFCQNAKILPLLPEDISIKLQQYLLVIV